MYDDDDLQAGAAQAMTEQDLIGITDDHIRQSIGYMGGKLAEQRRRNEYYYLAQPVGDLAPPGIEGRSQVVSTDVADTVEWMLPGLVKTFTAGENIVEFSPRRAEDEAAARQATEYVNYVLHKQNPGFMLVHTWIKDALIQKAGVLKVWWDDSTEDVREVYRGLSDIEVQMLLSQPEVEPVEHAARPDEQAAQVAANMAAVGMPAQPEQMVHDVVVKRSSKRGQVRIENVPPEEFLIDRRAKSIDTAAFVAHRVEKTISDLRALGYENVDDIGSDSTDNAGAMNMERLERRSFDDEMPYMFGQDVSTSDESQRVVWVTECYLRCDYNGDGIAEWRQVVRCGGVVLRNVECDGPPFVAVTPVLLPHRFFGLCPADQAIEAQKLKTSLLRASLDGLYHSINGRTYAVEGQVNLDDLVTSRPGGVVRVKSPGMVGPLQEGKADLGAAQALLEYAEVMKENRTGFTRYSQGSNADALNQTAQGMNIITNRSDSRVELIARHMAETGFTDLFRRILQLVSQYQDKATIARVGGEWVDMDPRAWRTQFDFTVNAGLGSNNKDQQVGHLMALIQQQKEALAVGLCTPKELFHSAKQLCQALGFRQPDLFFADPAKQPPKPPQPDPEQMKAQAQMQMEQAKIQAQMQAKQAEAQLQAQVDTHRQQVEAEQQQLKLAQEREIAAMRIEFERWKAELQANTQIFLAQMAQGAAQAAAAEQAGDVLAGEAIE